MATITKFEDIQAWQKGRTLTKRLYELCNEQPLARDYGLCDQIRRSAVSICSNIAEGFGRERPKELLHFLHIAKGSVTEFQSQCYHLLDAGYIDEAAFHELYQLSEETKKLIGGFINYLEKQQP